VSFTDIRLAEQQNNFEKVEQLKKLRGERFDLMARRRFVGRF